MAPRNTFVMAALAAITLIGSSIGAQADTDREKALEARIKALERTVQELVNRDTKLPNAQQARRVRSEPETPAKETPAKDVAQIPEQPKQSASGADGADTGKLDKPLPQPGLAAADEPPQELNVLRDNTVTLKPKGFEISTELDYIHNQTNIQRDRAIINNTTVRYGVLNWLELSTNIPIGYTTRTSDISPINSVVNHTSGLGDISAQANMRVFDQTSDWPGVVVTLGFQAPTGPDPYDFSLVRNAQQTNGFTPNPRNPLFDYFSQGSWVLHSNLQFYKTLDPVILFAGFGLDYVFPYSTSGYTISGFNRWSYNFGLSLALSEKSTIGFSINGNYSPNIKINDRGIFKTEQEPTYARLSFIQRIVKNWYLEPSMAFGLDADAPDYIIGLGVRARF